MEANAAAAETIPGNIERNSFLPLHPGAIRYYRQIGKSRADGLGATIRGQIPVKVGYESGYLPSATSGGLPRFFGFIFLGAQLAIAVPVLLAR